MNKNETDCEVDQMNVYWRRRPNDARSRIVFIGTTRPGPMPHLPLHFLIAAMQQQKKLTEANPLR